MPAFRLTSERIKVLLAELEEETPDALLADGFESAFLGIMHRFGSPPLAAYSFEACIMVLIERDGMSYEEAVEFFEYNVLGAGMGENTPVFIRTEPIR
jgi:hypothetical protein